MIHARRHRSIVVAIALLMSAAACAGATIEGHGRSAGSEPGAAAPVTGALFVGPQPWTEDVSALAQGRRSDAIIAALDPPAAGATATSSRSTSRSRSSSPTARRRARPSPRRPAATATAARLRSGAAADAAPRRRQHRRQRRLHLRHGNNDCHVLVVETAQKKLYELYNSTQTGRLHRARRVRLGSDQGLSRQRARRSVHLGRRGGLPDRGAPAHRRRGRRRRGQARAPLHPAQRAHEGGRLRPPGVARRRPSSTNANAPPYGVRFRLKAAFDETPFNAGEKRHPARA